MGRDASEPQRCESLFRSLIDHEGDADANANDLLKCFFRGYPLDNLRELLRSDDPEVAKAGVWIASELGARAKVLLDDVVPILGNLLPYARFFAIDAILGANGDDAEAVASVIRLVDDADSGVRWKVVQFLSRASRQQLEAAASLLEDPLASALRRFLDDNEIKVLLESESGALRRLALAAAIRAAPTNLGALRAVAASTDEEVSAWAVEELEQRGN
ncbi:MAG: hypothetical protein JWN44_1462 [Myxococcales bacterium]|nr:hypothetical protein [Myxococcales bacterium]